MTPRNIFVLFDSSCELCRLCKNWLQTQRQAVSLTFIPASSDEAKSLFPSLNHDSSLTELTVVADNGAVYLGAKAWIVCLWALADYRSWACTMADPSRMPLARRFVTMISDNRKEISTVIGRIG